MFFILLGFDDNKVLFTYFYIFKLCSGRAFQRYIDNGNPTPVSDMAGKNIKCASNFGWTIDLGFLANINPAVGGGGQIPPLSIPL